MVRGFVGCHSMCRLCLFVEHRKGRRGGKGAEEEQGCERGREDGDGDGVVWGKQRQERLERGGIGGVEGTHNPHFGGV